MVISVEVGAAVEEEEEVTTSAVEVEVVAITAIHVNLISLDSDRTITTSLHGKIGTMEDEVVVEAISMIVRGTWEVIIDRTNSYR